MTRKRWYVGVKGASRTAFATAVVPTPDTCQYAAVIGPFRTRRAAVFMAKHGRNNPHLRSVADAERIVKETLT